MSRAVTTAFRRALNRQNLGDAVLILLKLDHPTLTSSIRVTSDSTNTISNGQTYIPYAFTINLPDERLGVMPEPTLTIDNTDQTIIAALRGAGDTPISLIVRVVLASAPNTVELEIDELDIMDVQYDVFTISGRITQSPVLDFAFPADRWTPNIAPGLFRT